MHSFGSFIGPSSERKGNISGGIPGVNSELLGKHKHNMASYEINVAFDARWIIPSRGRWRTWVGGFP